MSRRYAASIGRLRATVRDAPDVGRVEVMGEDVRRVLSTLDALDLTATRLESERATQRARAAAAEAECARLTTERDAARAEAAGLRAIAEAADELVFCDYAAEVESYSETAPGSHAAAQVRAAEAYDALVRMRDAWRETHGAIATPPTVAAESATVAPKGKR